MKLEDQIGCGYCIHEKTCQKRNPKVNQAKSGCKEYLHHESKTDNRKKK